MSYEILQELQELILPELKAFLGTYADKLDVFKTSQEQQEQLLNKLDKHLLNNKLDLELALDKWKLDFKLQLQEQIHVLKHLDKLR